MMCNYISWQTKCFQLSGLEVVGIHNPKKKNPPSCQTDLPVGCDIYTQIQLYQFPLFPSFSTFILLLPLTLHFLRLPFQSIPTLLHFTLFFLHPISSFVAFTHSTFLPFLTVSPPLSKLVAVLLSPTLPPH